MNFILMIILVLTPLCLYLLFKKGNTIDIENINIDMTNVNNKSKREPKTIKIAHVSDTHLRRDEKNRILEMAEKIKKESPDLIVLTGDIIDSLIFDNSLDIFCKEITNIATTYAVSGNHEELYDDFHKWIEILESNDIKVLNNKSIIHNDLCIAGVPSTNTFDTSIIEGIDLTQCNKLLLLAHRPETFFKHYNKDNSVYPDLILSGHAHGGQFRFLNRGLYSPQQGAFPSYTSGLYTNESQTTQRMIVSRGVGHCAIPIRLNNPMHIPVITITY